MRSSAFELERVRRYHDVQDGGDGLAGLMIDLFIDTDCEEFQMALNENGLWEQECRKLLHPNHRSDPEWCFDDFQANLEDDKHSVKTSFH